MANTQLILETIIKGADSVTSGLKTIDNALSKSTEASKKFAMGMAVLSTAVVVGIGESVAKFAEFEKEMSGVKAATNASAEDMKKLTDLAAEMGAKTKFTAKEAAEGMGFLAKAGFDTQEIMASIPGVMSLAAASSIDLGSAADMAAGILSAFNLEAKEMGRVADVMAKAVNMSQIDMVDMNESMKYMAPTANVLGLTLEETSAAIALFGENNLKGGIATRAFASSLARLADPTDKMIEGMNAAGLAAFDSEGKFVGLKNMIAQLEVGMADMTEQQKLATLSQIFGAEAFKNVAILMNEGSESLGQYTDQLKDSEGAAAQMAATMMDNLPGSIELLSGALDMLMIQIGGLFSDGIRGVVDQLTAWVNKMSELIPKIQELWRTSETFRIGMIMVAGALTGALIPAFTALAEMILTSVIPALAEMAIALAPYMIAGAVIAAVVAGVYYLITSWDEASARISAAVDAIANWLSEKFTALSTALGGIWDTIRNKFMEVWDVIGNYVIGIVGTITGMMLPAFIKMAAQAIVSTAIVIAQWVANGAAAAASAVVTTVTAIPSIIAGFGKMVASAVATGVAFVGQWVLMGAQSLLQAARVAAAWFIAMGPVGWVTGLIVALVALIVANWDKVKEVTANVWNAIKEFFVGVGTAIAETVTGFIDAIVGGWTAFTTKIQELWSSAWNAMKDFVGGVVDGIVGTISKIAEVVSGVIGKLKEAIGLSNDAAKSSSKIGGGGGGSKKGPGKATGGAVFPGISYPVGERGIEMFTPATAGHITANRNLNGGGPTYNIFIDTMVGDEQFAEVMANKMVNKLSHSVAF